MLGTIYSSRHVTQRQLVNASPASPEDARAERAHLSRGPADDKVAGDASPVPLPKLPQAQEEQSAFDWYVKQQEEGVARVRCGFLPPHMLSRHMQALHDTLPSWVWNGPNIFPRVKARDRSSLEQRIGEQWCWANPERRLMEECVLPKTRLCSSSVHGMPFLRSCSALFGGCDLEPFLDCVPPCPDPPRPPCEVHGVPPTQQSVQAARTTALSAARAGNA